MRKGVDVAVALCLVLACAGILLATGALRGWLVLGVGGSLGIALLFSRSEPDRRVATPIGVYALLTAISVGLPKVWVPTPSWVHFIAEASFWVSLGAIFCAAWFARARGRLAATTD